MILKERQNPDAGYVLDIPVRRLPDRTARSFRYETAMLRDLETDLAGVHLSPLGYTPKAQAMASIVSAAAERLAWVERTA